MPLGEPFNYRVLLINRGAKRVRVLPIFFHSRDFLQVTPISCGSTAESASFTADFEAGLTRDDFVVLGLDSLVGQEFLVSPNRPFEYMYGLTQGACRLRATLHLHSFSEHFRWETRPAVEAVLQSNTAQITFAPPLEESVMRRRSQLQASDLAEVSEALAYFSSVQAQGVGDDIMSLLGVPQGWTRRFHDPAGAIWALRRNAPKAASRYFEAARSSRYRDLALEALNSKQQE